MPWVVRDKKKKNANTDANKDDDKDDFYASTEEDDHATSNSNNNKHNSTSSSVAEQPTTLATLSPSNNNTTAWTCREIAVYLILLGELACDAVVIHRGLSNASDAYCCDQPMGWVDQQGNFVTLGYLVLVIVELLLYMMCLARDIYQKRHGLSSENYDNDDYFDDSMQCCAWRDCCSPWNVLFSFMCLNPFVGVVVLWTQLYLLETDKQAWMWLTMEVVAVLFWYVAVYLNQGQLALCTLLLQCLHWAPLAVMSFYIWYWQEKGGICFLNKEQAFWFDGCNVCADGYPPTGDDKCPDGDVPTPQTFCGGDAADQFCFFGL